MIQAHAPRGWMQIQMSPSRSPGGRSSPSTQDLYSEGEERDAWWNLRTLLEPKQARKNPAVPAAIEDEAGLKLEPPIGLEIENAQRDLIACELDRFDLVIVADVHAVPSGSGGQCLVEVVSGHLERLSPLPGEDVGETETLAALAIQEEGRVLGLVPAGDDRVQQSRVGQDVVGPGKERLADLEPGKRASLEGDDPVALAREERASDAAGRPSSDDEDVGVHGQAVRQAELSS